MQQRQALPNDLSGHVEVTALPNVYSVVAAANLPALQVCTQQRPLSYCSSQNNTLSNAALSQFRSAALFINDIAVAPPLNEKPETRFLSFFG